VLFVICYFLQFHAFAAISDNQTASFDSFSSQQVPFFKTPESAFPSGAASLESLQKNQIGQTFRSEIQYKYGSQVFPRSELKPIFPTHISQSVIDPKTKKHWSVLETKVDSVLVFDSVTKTSAKFNIDDVTSDPYDLGFVLTLKDSYLKNAAKESGKIVTTVPGGTRFSVLKYTNGFAEVSYKTYVGYIPVSELITKFDFATYIYANKKWNIVKRRIFDFVETSDGKKIHLNKITGVVTPNNVGLVASSTQKIPIWSHVETTLQNKPAWIQSQIKDHGTVWWKPNVSGEEKIFTIDDLMKKEIASISFHPKDPLKAIMSANGVFITDDGYHWKELKEFRNFNGPVHYFNDLMIFVGNFRSTDQGKTFENYIQIEKLASAIELEYGFLPKRLQVKRIETLPPYLLKIEIEAGGRHLRMQSPLFAQSWSAVKG
jgi:hypothetical protein